MSHVGLPVSLEGGVALSGDIICDVDNLMSGKTLLDVRNFSNLCVLTNACILYPQMLVFPSGLKFSSGELLETLKQAGAAVDLSTDITYAYKDGVHNDPLDGIRTALHLNSFMSSTGLPFGHEPLIQKARGILVDGKPVNTLDANGNEFDWNESRSKDSEGMLLLLSLFSEFMQDKVEVSPFDFDKYLQETYGLEPSNKVGSEVLLKKISDWQAPLKQLSNVTGLDLINEYYFDLGNFICLPKPSTTRPLYKAIASQFRINIENLTSTSGARLVYTPPLVSLLLSRCSNREEIPVRMLEMRSEFSKLAQVEKEFSFRRNSQELTLAERVRAEQDYQRVIVELGKSIADSKPERLIYGTWDVLKSGNPIKMAAQSIDKFIEWKSEIEVQSMARPFLNLKEQVYSIRKYEGLVGQVFRENFDEDQVKQMKSLKFSNTD